MAPGAVEVNNTNINAKQGASFDGVDDFVQIPHNANQLGANLSDGFTLSAWINPKNIGEITGSVLDKSTAVSGVDGFVIRNSGTNKMALNIDLGTQAVSGNNSTPYGIWSHILVTISSGHLVNWYVNGILSGAANQDTVKTIADITTTNPMRIGNRPTATDRSFDGAIKDVKMWNKVLDSSERTDDFAGKTPQNNLILNVPLLDDYNDKSPTGLIGTNSGTHFAIVDDAVAAAIKADRTTANDQYMIATAEDGQVITTVIEEAP